MKTSMRIMAAALACVVGIAGQAEAEAAIVIRDYQTAGDGLITLDTDTGLEWLDVSLTLGETVNQSLAAYAGFDLATYGQFATLLTNMGFNHIDTGYDLHLDDLPAAELFVSTIGLTDSAFAGAVRNVRAHIKSGSDAYDMWEIHLRTPPASPLGVSNRLIELGNCYGCGASSEANFMVRAGVVPEPASWAMMIIGFGVLGGTMRRRNLAMA